MTNSESKFRVWAKKQYPGALIKKIPDFKMMGGAQGASVGLPDYVVFYEGESIWYEVKSGFGDTINLKNHFTDGQKIAFSKMLKNNVDIRIWCLTKSYKHQIIGFSDILQENSMRFRE